uniref:UspA domain-containing protein n=1 Tax=Picea sitchensis TaxID=3332 RepID=A9NVD5_PICSI|nr:unknown [Picea sitchensis]ABK26721.1 unknown [Picea sitchensis]ACN40891.1 unknown [Picea sitchensis]
MVKNIVVAVDESEESMHACEWACKHLSAIETPKVIETTDIQQQQQSYNMILIHVQSTASSFSAGPAYILSNQVFEFLDSDAKRNTQRVLNRALHICERYGVKAETHVVNGEAKERICEAAAKLGAHLLVVGSHGHGGFIRAIRGSVSDYCTRNSKCPVVVVNKKVFSG